MKELAKNLIGLLRNKYRLEGEVFLSESKGINIEVSDSRCEKFNLFGDIGIGIRLLKDKKWGLAYSTQAGLDADEFIKLALRNAEFNVRDEFNCLPQGNSPAALAMDKLAVFDPVIETMEGSEKMDRVFSLAADAMTPDKRITKVLAASYTDSLFEQTIMNTNGVDVSWRETFFSTLVELKAEQDTKIQVGGESQTKRYFRELDFKDLISQAVFRTVSMLGARSIPTRKIPVFLDPYVGSEFLAVLASGICADNIQRKKSPFSGKMDKMIAPGFISIVDDGTKPGGLGTSPFDDEGVPTRKTMVVDKGVLKAFLYDSYSACRDKVASTGNASRGSFMGAPGVGVNNFFLEPGTISREALLGSVKEGLYVMEVMGMHTVDPISGDFSVGVSGLWVENGRMSYPVQGVAMAGNVLDLLQNIEQIGNDLRFYGNVGCPTLKIKEVMISGE